MNEYKEDVDKAFKQLILVVVIAVLELVVKANMQDLAQQDFLQKEPMILEDACFIGGGEYVYV